MASPLASLADGRWRARELSTNDSGLRRNNRWNVLVLGNAAHGIDTTQVSFCGFERWRDQACLDPSPAGDTSMDGVSSVCTDFDCLQLWLRVTVRAQSLPLQTTSSSSLVNVKRSQLKHRSNLHTLRRSEAPVGGRGRAAGVPILTTTELLWAILQSAANTIISLCWMSDPPQRPP